MKIAYIAAGAGGMICGNCLRDNALAAALIELGHDVHLIPTYTPIRTDEPDVSSPRVFYGGMNVYLQQKSALFRHTPGGFDRLLDTPALLRWVSQFAVKTQPQDLGELTVSVLQGSEGRQAKELRKLIAGLDLHRPEVVHLTNSMLAGIAPAVKRELGIPVLCSLQGEDYFLSHLPSPYRERAFAVLKEMARSVDGFIAPCSDHAAAMAPHLGVPEDEIAVVLPGINLEGYAQRRERNPDEFVIGYLARVSPEKGLHLLADAFRQVHEHAANSGHRCRLRVAGWLGPEHKAYLEDIERRLRQWGLHSDFEYAGCIDRTEKLWFLQSLDVLSVPVSYRAPKGLYVLEALASGVPVVQPRLGIFPELIEATAGGLLFERESVDDLARALRELIDRPDEARQMGLQGREAVCQRFHARRAAEETVGVYQQFIH